MTSALIYDCLTLKKLSQRLPIKLKGMDLIVFKCACDKAQKSKISIESLNLKKIDASTIKADSEFAFFSVLARSLEVSLGEKSHLALAHAASNSLTLVTIDTCVISVAAAAEISCLKV